MNVRDQISVWVDQHVDRLTHLAFTYMRDWATAEDMVQESFIKAYHAIHQLKTPENPLPWLSRIVINECCTAKRKTWREVVTSLLPERWDKSAEDVYFQHKEGQDVHLAVMSLRETYRTPIYLYYLEGLSTQEIAEVLEITPGTLRVRLNRGRQQLQKELQKQLERGENDETRRTYSEFRTKV